MAMQINSNISDDNSVNLFVMQMIEDGITKFASDIHFEPYETNYRIRFRIDGILREAAKVSLSYAQRCSVKLKIMAKLDIAERRLPQDGRFTVILQNKETRDCRLSICPTLFGEKLVIRILNPSNTSYEISSLGLNEVQEQIFLDSIEASQGMILVTGPTGSGKTVTLYSALNFLNRITKNISTVEDPIEISLYGVNQVEANNKIGLTFSTALRTFLRQDPDIIMIGEIRDKETADIAVKAAQTGHLVLSTLHTNSAADTITRLLNMGIATFNLASSLNLIIAQRLLRKVCPFCKQEYTISEKTLQQNEFISVPNMNTKVYKAAGCSKCHNGYLGRTGIFELLQITPTISGMILDHSHASLIDKEAVKNNMQTLRQQALSKFLQGITTLEEITRVIL